MLTHKRAQRIVSQVKRLRRMIWHNFADRDIDQHRRAQFAVSDTPLLLAVIHSNCSMNRSFIIAGAAN